MTPQAVTNPLPACADCGALYGGPGWCDVVVPNDVWRIISPTGDEGGLLCFGCIARRCEIWDLGDIPYSITSGPFERDRVTPCAECGRSAFRAQRCLDHFVTDPTTGIDVYRETP